MRFVTPICPKLVEQATAIGQGEPPWNKLTRRRVFRVDDEAIQDHLGRVVRDTVEETLNAMLDAEADVRVGARRAAKAGAFRARQAGVACQGWGVTLKVPERGSSPGGYQVLPLPRDLRGGGLDREVVGQRVG